MEGLQQKPLSLYQHQYSSNSEEEEEDTNNISQNNKDFQEPLPSPKELAPFMQATLS